MFSLNLFRKPVPWRLLGPVVFLPAVLLLPSRPAHCQASDWSQAVSAHAVDHLDPIVVDATLTLPKLIDLTMEKYPDVAWLTALEAEAAAIADCNKIVAQRNAQLAASGLNPDNPFVTIGAPVLGPL